MNPLYQQARFLASAARPENAPPDEGLEVAFAGRSNAGKSSAINTITRQGHLARVSKTPGRTQLINFFHLDDTRRLVDLPGYGYAKVSVAVHQTWGAMIENYLSRRKALCGVFLIMDIRHPLREFDERMIEWCRHFELPFHIALTKSDKLSRGAALEAVLHVRRALEAAGEDRPSVQAFSSLKRVGIDQAHTVLDRWLRVTSADDGSGSS